MHLLSANSYISAPKLSLFLASNIVFCRYSFPSRKHGKRGGPIRLRSPERQNQSGFTTATDSEWQWHKLGHMQICTSPQTDNYTSIPPLSFFTALPTTQPTASYFKHCIGPIGLSAMIVIRVRVSRVSRVKVSFGLWLGFRVRVVWWTGIMSAQLLGPIGGPLCKATL